MSSSIDLAGSSANLVVTVSEKITTEKIYTFVQNHRSLSTEALRIDPSDGEWLFLPVLNSIIENPDTPPEIRVTANAMYHSEHIRGW